MTQSYMQSEVAEQPALIRRQSSGWKSRAQELRHVLFSRKQIILVGRGSSGNAALYFTYLWATSSGRQPIDFRLWLAQEHNQVGDYSDCAVLAFSASGQSTDVVRACAWLKERGALVIGVTAAADSACRLGGVADELFLLNCGLEKSVPATKSFMAQLAASAALSGMPISERSSAVAIAIEKTIASPASSVLADFFTDARTVIMLGRGLLLGAVHDAALKLQETTGLAAFAYSTAEFFHGPLGCVSPKDRIVLFISGDIELELRLLKSLAERAIPVTVIIRNSLSIPREVSTAIVDWINECGLSEKWPILDLVSTGHDWSDAFPVVALAQMTSLTLCGRMGRSPDTPPLLKKVTET